MKVLITGSSGFIASYLIPQLAERGDEVVGFDLAPPPENLVPLGTFYRGDLSAARDLYRVMATERPSHIVHLASILAGPCEENPSKGFEINFGSTLTLLDAASAVGSSHFVLASSIAVFGRGVEEPVADDAVKEPATIYGKTKLASEQVVEWYRRKRNIEAIALRFPWVFGPGRERGITAMYSSKLLDAIARREPLVIDNPDERGDWLYVKDAVRAVLLALESSKQHQTGYNIMGSVHTIREVLTIATHIVPGASVEFKQGEGALSPYPSAYDDSKARKELGWAPTFSIEDAVKDHIGQVSGRQPA